MASLQYRLMAGVVRLSGIKKMFVLPEDELLKKIRKLNQKRNFHIPNNQKAIYGDRVILERYHCLTIQTEKAPKKKAVLFFFGGGMCIGPDQGDVNQAVTIAKQTDSDVWFPYYPLCTDHPISETSVKSFMEHGERVPDYMLSGISGDFSGLPCIHFYYGGDEVLSAEAEYFEEACRKADTPYSMTIEPGMCHCYAMQTRFPEGRKAFGEIMGLLR